MVIWGCRHNLNFKHLMSSPRYYSRYQRKHQAFSDTHMSQWLYTLGLADINNCFLSCLGAIHSLGYGVGPFT